VQGVASLCSSQWSKRSWTGAERVRLGMSERKTALVLAVLGRESKWAEKRWQRSREMPSRSLQLPVNVCPLITRPPTVVKSPLHALTAAGALFTLLPVFANKASSAARLR